MVLDVFATWCGPCQFMAPALEEVAQKLEGKVRVLKIDSDAEPDVSNTLQIRGLPTILLINDMSVIMRVEGALEANELLQLVDHYLFGGPPPQAMLNASNSAGERFPSPSASCRCLSVCGTLRP